MANFTFYDACLLGGGEMLSKDFRLGFIDGYKWCIRRDLSSICLKSKIKR